MCEEFHFFLKRKRGNKSFSERHHGQEDGNSVYLFVSFTQACNDCITNLDFKKGLYISKVG